MAYDEEARAAERQLYFVGSAKVHLKHVAFDVNDPQQQQPTSLTLDAKNVDRLIQVFKLEGCLRLDLAHHIPAIISPQTLQESLRQSKVEGTMLFQRQNPPTLLFPENTYLSCLHGKHRIAAARAILLPGNMWWTVDLYLDNLSERVRRDVREEYANSKNFCDGDIFQQIRFCQKELDHQGEGRWMARLSEAKRKDLKQLQRKLDLKPLVEALDSLLPFVGLWPSLQIGTFHRLLNLRCPEELQNYLVHVRWCWDHILDQNESLRPLVDFRTVQLLETLNPRASIRDGNKIELWMGDKTLFPMVADSAVRTRIFFRLTQLDRMIPSLHTFLEDTKWLEPCAKIVRSLLPSGCRDPTRTSIFRMYNGSNILRVQDRRMMFTEFEGSEMGNVTLSYLQLWLFAWRHFPELSGLMPRKDKGEPKPKAKASNEQCRYQFAQLASSLGFKSSIISAFQERNPDKIMALDFLREARPEEFCRLPEGTRSNIASKICEALPINGENDIIPSERPGAIGEIDIAKDHRFGRPHEQSHNYSKTYFFLDDIYAERTQSLSYYKVNQDIFLAFFGVVNSWKPSNEDEMEDDLERQVNPRTNPDDRMDGETTNLHNNSFAVGSSVAPISLPQSSANTFAPEQSVGPIIESTDRMDTDNAVLHQSRITVANDEAPASLPERRALEPGSLALVPVTTTQERGLEQYGAQGDESVRQIEAANEILDGEDVAIPDAVQGHDAQLVPHAPPRRMLQEAWKNEVRTGDLFFLRAESHECYIVRSGDTTPVHLLASLTSCHWVAWDGLTGGLVSVVYNQMHRYTRSHASDGIIFIFKRSEAAPDRFKELLTGVTPEERLCQLEDDCDTIN